MMYFISKFNHKCRIEIEISSITNGHTVAEGHSVTAKVSTMSHNDKAHDMNGVI